MDRSTPIAQPAPSGTWLSQAEPREGDEEEPGLMGDIEVVYKLRDISAKMVESWQKVFGDKPYMNSRIEVSKGDIFKGGPAADAIVSPANSFGFMDGGIDAAYSRHFGWGMSERLRKMISEKMYGEILVGDAVIIPTNVKGEAVPAIHPDVNEGQPIKWLISAPTMRVPLEVVHTMNSYLAFRAVILAVKRFNSNPDVEPIRSVLCPGLGTAVGRMPPIRCARQMLRAFETIDLKMHPSDLQPQELAEPWKIHLDLVKVDE